MKARRRIRPFRQFSASRGVSSSVEVRAELRMTYQSERLSEEHDLRPFESSEPDLDRWLKESALRAQKQPAGRTYVWHEGDKVVVAHFTLLGHVLIRGIEAGRIVAFRYVVVDAISENAAGFYQRFGFIPIPDTSPVRLIRKLA